jgi:hypothetical protein
MNIADTSNERGKNEEVARRHQCSTACFEIGSQLDFSILQILGTKLHSVF